MSNTFFYPVLDYLGIIESAAIVGFFVGFLLVFFGGRR